MNPDKILKKINVTSKFDKMITINVYYNIARVIFTDL